MRIKDETFGELQYEFGWSRTITLNFFGDTTEMDLMIDGEEEGEFDEGQYIAYKALMNSWEAIQHSVLTAILSYYKRKRIELGYDKSLNEKYPLVETTHELLEMISLEGLVVPYADIFEARHIGLTLNCSWDNENGIGIRLLNEEVSEVGYQDVAI
ncbi:hypothetical protein N781_09620 [Pontibacillus halophilus JSM 076056 = DSM 19796]|uniref:DUF6985 domain-containing protein n=1 Tax=Pontibacillus halophilus JSM 076056 = DSM 19796 TaxID=1385510 RepID=A0A0A5HYS4_9BACI|nr:DUF2004 domain-containing protein [Pontibacillus halophilus]KGX88767.1 hypothetical protein N781_09620 [Pontibacillus halophilus JSM 076056 = DSM 19796]